MTEDSLVASAPAPDIFAVYATAHGVASAMAYLHSQAIVHGNLQGDSLGLANSSQDKRGFVVKVLTHSLTHLSWALSWALILRPP